MQQLKPSQAAERLAGGWAPFVLDVRTQDEADVSNLAFTDMLCAHDCLESILDRLPQDRDLLIYCRSGGRSAYACAWLEALGYGPTYNLDGGINAWAQSVDPTLTVY